jgi:outer membrane protein
MNSKLKVMSALVGTVVACGAAQAQDVVKLGFTRYDTSSKTTGVVGIGVPAGADATTGDANTIIGVYEHLFRPDFGVELVLGVPPKITGTATGSVAFLGEVLSARNVAPTLLFNYHFGGANDALRPYLGIGVNYTRFVNVKSTLASDVHMSDSVGLAVQAGVDYWFNKQWGMFASIAKVQTKSDLVASGSTVIQTTIDFRPMVYSMGLNFRF